MSLLLAALALTPHAAGAEVTWEGFYRGRLRLFDSLSMSNSNGQAEGSASSFDHRLRLAPTFTLSENVEIHADLGVLAYTRWGDAANTWDDPLTGASIALAEADGVATSAASISARRAWAEAYTPAGRFAVGRMPMDWGAGLLWNPGDDVLSEFGDTADRFAWTGRFGPAFVLAAFDLHHEGFVADGVDTPADDMAAISAAVGFRSETAGLGLLNNLRYQGSNDWLAYTGDLWGLAEIGPLRLETEVVATFGAGDLDTGANDVSVMAFGAMLDGAYDAERFVVGIEGGIATGDTDPTDADISTFSFDRDYNVALLLFEEPLPTLATTVQNDTNEGRTTEAALTADGVSNALYVKPSFTFRPRKDLELTATYVTAGLAAGPAATDGRTGMGHEIDLDVSYRPFPHLRVAGTAGVLIPGRYYSEYADPDLGGGFDRAVFGARVLAIAEF